MKLVLFRHAQKGIIPFDDPQLTESGFQQAEGIYGLVKKNILPAPTQAWVSPKIRTTQTLKAVCENFKVPLQVTRALDVRNSDESSEDFRNRVADFFDLFGQRAADEPDDVHYLCTHYDVIEDAMTLINADRDLNSFEFSHWAPTQFIVFEIAASQEAPWVVVKKGSASATKND